MTNESEKKVQDLSALRIDPESRRAPSGGGGRRAWIVAGVAAALLLLVLMIMGLSKKARVEVSSARPAGGSEALTVLNASGYVTPRLRATVAAKITGRVKEMLVEEGMRVEQGQVLALLDDRDAQADFAAAKADLDVAVASIPELEVTLADQERTLARNLALREKGFVDQQTLDGAQAAVDGTKARLDLARHQVEAAQARMDVAARQIDNCTVRAPFAGIAVSKDAQPGEIVSPVSAGGGFTRTGISTIVDMTSLEVEVDVNEAYIAKVKPGQPVESTLDAYPDWQIPSKVRTVIPTADRQKATVKVRISFDKLDPRILPDMGVKVAFLSAEPAAGGPKAKAIIPKQAVRQEQGSPVAFVLRDGQVERRPLTLGEARGTDVEVLAGLLPGDQVVISGPSRLKDGQKVVVKK
jgi:RND family efflux transporter MFP subunit